MKRIILLILILILTGGVAFAAPSITSTSGTVSDGNTVTISGSAFGAKATAAPIKWDDFEDGTSGTALATVDPSWSAYSGTGALYTNTDSHTGSLSVQNDASGGGSNYETNVYEFSPASDEVFISMWIKVETDGSWGSCNNKMTRIGTTEDGTNIYHDAGFKLSDYPYLFYNDGNTSTYFNAPDQSLTDAPLNTWWHLQMYEKLSTIGGTDGEVFGNAVGYHLEEFTGENNRSTDFSLTGIFMGLAVDSCDVVTRVIYADDVYIDRTQARVELGNASTYSACTHREMQIPSAWSTSSVDVTVNTGTFATDDVAYLYVVDETGAVNSTGYEVTVGTTSTDTTPSGTLTLTGGASSVGPGGSSSITFSAP